MELRKVANADGAPYRERAEVFAYSPQHGVYGGQWDSDKMFAVPGGGIDDGEDIAQGAAREFQEETGMAVRNPRLLAMDPVISEWSEKHRATLPPEKQKYLGSRSHFVLANLDELNPTTDKLDQWSAKERRFYTPDEAVAMGEGKTSLVPPMYEARMKVLQHIKELMASQQKTAEAHKIVNGNCGHAIFRCRCPGPHEIEVVDCPCAKCIQAAADEAQTQQNVLAQQKLALELMAPYIQQFQSGNAMVDAAYAQYDQGLTGRAAQLAEISRTTDRQMNDRLALAAAQEAVATPAMAAQQAAYIRQLEQQQLAQALALEEAKATSSAGL